MRPILVAFAGLALGAAGIMAVVTPAPVDDELPVLSSKELRGIVIRPGAAAEVRIAREVAVSVIRRSVFLDEGPEREPETFPVLATGHFARAPIQASPTGVVVVPLLQDAPAWLVVWRGLRSATLERFGDWPPEALVDAVFLVDGTIGDCCWATRFLAGEARLDQRQG